ncbi:MAG: bifunctional pyr operon transcriptional regulator/uracil phosphoribosyltransferase PyrR [Acidiferrobacterales bacterium]
MQDMLQTIDIDATLAYMADELKPRLALNPIMIGVHTGGAWVANRLHQALGMTELLGTLDISFYRDDFTRVGVNPQVKTSNLPVNLEDRHVILVDDVLHTGRTVRAALNEIFDYGRPASVSLAVLICRDGRELPVEAQVIGHTLRLEKGEHIKLVGPDPLALTLQRVAD